MSQKHKPFLVVFNPALPKFINAVFWNRPPVVNNVSPSQVILGPPNNFFGSLEELEPIHNRKHPNNQSTCSGHMSNAAVVVTVLQLSSGCRKRERITCSPRGHNILFATKLRF